MKSLTVKYISFCLVFFIPCFSFSQNSIIDSLTSAIKTAKEDTNKLKTFVELSKQHRELSNHAEALHYAHQAQQLAEKLLNASNSAQEVYTLKKNMAFGFQIIGNVYADQGNYNDALSFFSKALAVRQEIKDKLGIASSLNNMGLISWKQGLYVKALDYYFKALPIAEEIKRKPMMANLYNNIGIIYKAEGNLTKGLDYYTKALKIREELNDKQSIAASLDNIAIIYNDQKDYEKALEQGLKALALRKEANDKTGIGHSYNNIGLIYENRKNYTLALDYYFKSLFIREEIKDKQGVSLTLFNISSIYIEQKNYPLAKEYSARCLKIAEEIGSLEIMKDAYQAVYEINEKTGNIPNALTYFKKYIQARDSLLNKENTEKSLRTEMNFEFEKKEALNKAEQEKKDELQNEKNRRQTVLIWAISGVLLLVFVFAVLIWRNNLQKQKANNALDEKQKEILNSIHYAKRIQRALITSDNYLSKHLKDFFIYYNPKDIVSGDFYWALDHENKFYIITADCTGHGVPGAFMSLINISFLNEVIVERQITRPDLILNEVRKNIIKALNPEGKEEGKDGMDCVLCCFDFKNNVVEFASANNSFYIVRNKELLIFKSDKMPVGKGERTDPFTYNKVSLQQGDIIYTFTDGYADQFGGPQGKKFKSKQQEEVLLSNSHLSMEEQKNILSEKFDAWKGKLEQVDDVLVIGIKI
ncbi:MAG TPA: tetratricopeptide repeat protein [Bacteroidia bacterium]|nr:tetratricopeptide repeat protein [Bacteroidia bacterium]